MIGQKKLKSNLDKLVKSKKLPRVLILVGQKGSGKHLMATYIGDALGIATVMCGIKAEDVKDVVEQSYKNMNDILYVFPDVQKMSTVGHNALLKITEEPPNNAYFILTVDNEQQILNTLTSRGTVFRMDTYAPKEILEYAKEHYPQKVNKSKVEKVLLDICETPGEVDLLMGQSVIEFYDYVNFVIDNIAKVSGANSFKIADQVNLADDDTKYDLVLFWKAFMTVCLSLMQDDPLRYSSGVKITSKYLQELKTNGINKQSTFDMWLLAIRKEWL